MTGENRRSNAAEEWRFSRRFLEAADHLAAAQMFDRATAQLYFALLHAVRAILFTEGVEPRTHRGAAHLLNIHFVIPGRLDQADLGFLRRLQDEREGADYAIQYPNDRARYAELRARIETSLATIRELLASAGVALEP